VIAVGVTLWVGRGAFETPRLVASAAALVNQTGNPLPIFTAEPILRKRGILYDAEIELPTSPQAIELRVLPEVEARPSRYRVALVRIADDDSLTPIGSVAGLSPHDDGFVVVYFDSSKLTRGRYQLTVGGDVDTDAANEVSRFSIKLTPASDSSSTP